MVHRKMSRQLRYEPVVLAGLMVLMGNLGCQAERPSPAPDADDVFAEPGSAVQVPATSVPSALTQLLDEARATDAEALLSGHAVEFDRLGYDPLEAQGLELLQGSNLALQEADLAALQRQGFVIAKDYEFPSFFYSYLTIYGEDLPVYVSLDSILDAVHRSYSDILADLERTALAPELLRFLTLVRERLESSSQLPSATRADLELYLAVAQGLLTGAVPSPLGAGVAEADVAELLHHASEALGISPVPLFGVRRLIDFSQFKPRGHYENDEVLEPYFRAMMWLGRIDFRMLETEPGSGQVLRRRQVEASLALRELLDAETRAIWNRIDAVIGTFVGEHDYMVVPQLDALAEDLGIGDGTNLAALSDQDIAEAIAEGGYGEQRIASHVIYRGLGDGTLPLNRSFAIFGQRYTVDSHIFSNVVYDRAGGGSVARWLPDPLDAAFAAFGNDQAAALLEGELRTYAYAPDLAAMRVLVDAHDADYWDSSLYTLWLSALRSLSPRQSGVDPRLEGLPQVARTEPWGRRILNTQLGSWSQLRHDTLLYAKQSYTVGTVCEFPDAYVDPYPETFALLGRYARRGAELIEMLDTSVDLSWWRDRLRGYFANLAEVTGILEEMAHNQRTGAPHSEEHLAFVNEVVRLTAGGSGPPSLYGWYTRLFYDPYRALEYDPVIADVHTDVGGVQRPPEVLHVATGTPRLMVVTVDTCTGPRLYAGPAFAYHEVRPGGLTRLTDSEWEEMLRQGPVAEVAWMEPVFGAPQR